MFEIDKEKIAKIKNTLLTLTLGEKNEILLRIKNEIDKSQNEILMANRNDVLLAIGNGLSESMIDRMSLNEDRIQSILTSIDNIIALSDPVNVVLDAWNVEHNGLHFMKKSCPIGTICIIYESRPNVTVDAAILCLKSSNVCILKGGSECLLTNKTIIVAIHRALGYELSNAVIFIDNPDRNIVQQIIKRDDIIDLIIPRGGKNLMKVIMENTTIPILKHLDGNCHTYIEKSANPDKAISVLINAKMRRTSVCGATESLLIDREIAKIVLPKIVDALFNANCIQIVGDSESCKIDSRILPATDDDYYTEYLDAKISVKIVTNIDDAIEHINKYSSHHTDCILTEEKEIADKFCTLVDSANVMHNVSTQLADGYEFGFGSEIGISTNKLHARGPVGLKELVIYKYVVSGDYTVR